MGGGGERMRWRQVVAGLSAPQHEEGQVQLLRGLRRGEALEEAPGAPHPCTSPAPGLPAPGPAALSCCRLLPALCSPLSISHDFSRLSATPTPTPPSLPHLHQPIRLPKGAAPLSPDHMAPHCSLFFEDSPQVTLTWSEPSPSGSGRSPLSSSRTLKMLQTHDCL